MAKYEYNMQKEKKFVLGQYFTKEKIVSRIIDLLKNYKNYPKESSILEPSAGTRNFITELRKRGFKNIEECEIDKDLTKNSQDFFLYDIKNKFDLIIGNPPFTKYNIKDSYYYPKKYFSSSINPTEYLTKKLIKKEKIKIENSFILKSIKHLKDKNSSIGFVLPISFFIANKNSDIKEIISNNFSTIIIYQNDKNWFEEPIPCCFAIFTNQGYGQIIPTLSEKYKNKIILLYEDGKCIEEVLDKSKLLTEELIPQSFLYKKRNAKRVGVLLSEYISEDKVIYNRDYKNNNISASNILTKTKIPNGDDINKYVLAVVRVGNSSVGKAGLINLNKDILNDMFYVFQFKINSKKLIEDIIDDINKNQEYFKNSTIRVGSKSIKKSDILNFRVNIK